nr:Sporulation inhibitor kipI [Klebsiella pneumoniae]
MRFLPCSLSSFLVELGTLDDTLALFAALQAAPLSGVEEIIPAARTLLIHFDPTLTQCHQLSAAIRQLDGQMQAQRTGKVVTIPVQYTGDDLAEMAEYLGLSVEALIQRHTGSLWQVAFCGFAPVSLTLFLVKPVSGFPAAQAPHPYSGGFCWACRRIQRYLPHASPGGWQIIGRTTETLFARTGSRPRYCNPACKCSLSMSRAPRSVCRW